MKKRPDWAQAGTQSKLARNGRETIQREDRTLSPGGFPPAGSQTMSFGAGPRSSATLGYVPSDTVKTESAEEAIREIMKGEILKKAAKRKLRESKQARREQSAAQAKAEKTNIRISVRAPATHKPTAAPNEASQALGRGRSRLVVVETRPLGPSMPKGTPKGQLR